MEFIVIHMAFIFYFSGRKFNLLHFNESKSNIKKLLLFSIIFLKGTHSQNICLWFLSQFTITWVILQGLSHKNWQGSKVESFESSFQLHKIWILLKGHSTIWKKMFQDKYCTAMANWMGNARCGFFLPWNPYHGAFYSVTV